MSLSNRIALVTGASRGIGRAVAIALAEAGADVAVNFRQRGDEAAEVVDAITARGRRAVAVRADVSDEDEVERLVMRVGETLGPIDILVNNAGLARPCPVEHLTTEVWDEAMAVNLRSAFLMTSAVLPGMRERGWGRLIYLSSVAAQIGGIVGPHYAASKAGLIGLMHGYASQLAKEGVTANAICPALVETEMLEGNPRARPELLPVGRFGLPEEVAAAAAMLAANGFVTGQTLQVNGGLYMT